MQEGIVMKIAEWSKGNLADEALLQAVEGARPDIEEHRSGFSTVVNDLTPPQQERCGDIVSFCFLMLDQLSQALDNVAKGVQEGDRNVVFIAGDIIARNSTQLNRAFVEFRNLALAALGPTDIPNFNLLLSRRDEYLEEPDDNSALLFKEAIDSERVIVIDALKNLAKEPQLPEVEALSNCFRAHLSNLTTLVDTLDSEGPEGDYDAAFEELEKTFLELQELVPMVQMKLRTNGETDFPDLNLLLKMMEDIAQGNIGDAPLIDALEAVDEAFTKSKETMGQVAGHLDSTLANDEIEAVLETFEEFEEGVEAIYKFLEERDRDWLVEAKGCLLEFAKRFSEHQKQLKQIEANQGKVLCPMCATYNDVTRSRCSKCGGPLPQNVAASATTTFETVEKVPGIQSAREKPLVTENIAKLYTAVNQVAAGEIDHQAFLEAVHKFEVLVEANVGNLPPEPDLKDPAKQENVEKVYDAFETGVEKLRSAIEIFRTFPEKNDEAVLAQAVTLVDEGAKLVAAAGEAVSR